MFDSVYNVKWLTYLYPWRFHLLYNLRCRSTRWLVWSPAPRRGRAAAATTDEAAGTHVQARLGKAPRNIEAASLLC